MPQVIRELSDAVLWYAHGRCFRFAYRDAYTKERRFLNCLPEKFRVAGILLPNDAVVRKNTDTARDFAERLRTVFLRSLAAIVPETAIETVPTISGAIEAYFDLFEQSPGYRKTLRWVFETFRDIAHDKPMDHIRDTDLKSVERHFAKTCSRTTVRSYMKQVSMLLGFSQKKGWIRCDPRLTYRLPKEELVEPNPFTPVEVALFFETVRTKGPSRGWGHLEFLGAALLTLGLRPVEAIHARWENVNWTERLLWVGKSHGAKEKQAIQWQPIPLAVWPMFLRHKRESGPIFTSYFGEPITEGALSRALRSIAKHVPGFTWKRWRKTFATTLAEAGHDGMTVSRLLRHSLGGRNVSVAQRHYVGQEIKRLRETVDAAFQGVAAVEEGAEKGLLTCAAREA